MKLARLPEYLSIVVTAVIGILLALYLGLSAGAGSNTTYLIIGSIIAVVIALVLRANIWLLIPLCWPLGGSITGMPGSFPVRDLVMLYAFAVFLALKALKVVRAKTQYNWLDYLLFLNLIYLFTIYIKNPVGTDSMGFERVGGKVYFEVLFLISGYWVIAHVTVSGKFIRKFPLLLICGDLLNGIVGFLTFHFPVFGLALGQVYSGVSLTNSALGGEDSASEREGYLTSPGYAVCKALFSMHSPFRVLNPIYFWRFLGASLGILMILKSGFRGTLVGLGFFFIASTYFRHGFLGVIRMTLIIIPCLCMLIAVQGIVELPLPMQRSLSFLPGNWNPAVVDDAKGSLEWRYDIWDRVRTSGHKYINDWWFGDGFGISKTQLQQALNSPEESQENLAIVGQYHSLPLSAIRVVGYVGFSLYCVLLFCMGVFAWKLIRRAKGTPFFPAALFIGVPAITSPPQELLLTGFFDSSILSTIFSIAIMQMISRSLEQYRRDQEELAPDAAKALPELVRHRFPSDLPGQDGSLPGRIGSTCPGN
ncbi:MAG: hypothetical protein NTZ46_07605 [Verrucomicrobia bacterium]|nr:hypothetical protein [Verrucomicrobiota bacterium]